MQAFASPGLVRAFQDTANSQGRFLTRNCAYAAKSDSSCRDAPSLLYSLRHGRALVREALVCAVHQSKSRTAIDATCGRGSDTITLGQTLRSGGLVHAVDVQAAAVAETRTRYECTMALEKLAKLRTHCASHADLSVLGEQPRTVAAIVYNLGWYPAHDADRSIVTRPHSTVSSLNSARKLLAPHGIIVITAYPAHPGGSQEADAVKDWARALDTREWSCLSVEYPNRNAGPCVHICERLK